MHQVWLPQFWRESHIDLPSPSVESREVISGMAAKILAGGRRSERPQSPEMAHAARQRAGQAQLIAISAECEVACNKNREALS